MSFEGFLVPIFFSPTVFPPPAPAAIFHFFDPFGHWRPKAAIVCTEEIEAGKTDSKLSKFSFKKSP